MNLTPKYNLTDFNRFLLKEIDLDIYQHKFLRDYIDKASKGHAPVSELSIINTSQTGWIMILHGDVLLIYGENWTASQIEEISKMFDLNTYTNYTLAGDSALIDKLVEFYKTKNSKIEKQRIFYRTSEVNTFNNDSLQIRNGSIAQLNKLALMLQEYYHEEYNGLNDKTIEEMQAHIFSVIQTNKIYVLLDKNEAILSFCTIIDPDIGIMFTNKEHRNMGFGKIILSYCTKLLHKKNKMVYVMTDANKVESNIVCEAVGFKPYYKYSMIKVNFR